MDLAITDLSVNINNKTILENISFQLSKGDICALVGPNGSGKSTIAQVLTGNDEYDVRSGSILVNGESVIGIKMNEIAQRGVFLAFQSPIEIPGLSYFEFLHSAYNSTHESLKVFQFRKLLRSKMEVLGIPEEFINRDVNIGFSGGERKKMEVLQILLFEPKLIILDEVDSGVDRDSLNSILATLQDYKDVYKDTTILLITHYNKVYDYLKPNKVIVLEQGKVKRVGDEKLLKAIESDGYKSI